jgi:hypothetical protein
MYVQPSGGYSRRYNRGRYKKPVNPLLIKFELITTGTPGITYDLMSNARNALPWTITKIKLTFDRAVTAVASDLVLTKINISGTVVVPTVIFPCSSVTGSGTNVLTFTLTTNMTLAGVRATILGYSKDFYVVYGDADGDKRVLSNDGTLVRNFANTGGYYSFYDIDANGVVDVTDFNIIRGRTGTGLS